MKPIRYSFLAKQCFLSEQMRLADNICCEGVPGYKLFFPGEMLDSFSQEYVRLINLLGPGEKSQWNTHTAP